MDAMFWRVRNGSEVHLLTSSFPSLGTGRVASWDFVGWVVMATSLG